MAVHGRTPPRAEPAASSVEPRGHVLVADDQPDVVEAVRLLLKMHGYAVASADSPAGVLEALVRAAAPFDLLVMDLNYARDTTSGREGLALVPRAKALDPQLPIVVMTAWSTVSLAVTIMREGVADFVEKPWDNARLLRAVEAQVAAGRAARRAARLERDAVAVQRRLLSRPAAPVPGFALGAAWAFAEDLGGDAHLVTPQPDGRLAVVVADVCGKGTPAALLMASLQATLEPLVAAGTAPRAACATLGRALAPRLGSGRFVSLVHAVLDRSSWTITVANAGHPPGLLLRGDGSVVRLEPGGPVLGILGEAVHEETVLPLAARDRLVVVTDGVLEATRGGGEPFGEDRLRAALLARRHEAAEPCAAAVLAEARAFAGGRLDDDATVVVVDVTGRAG